MPKTRRQVEAEAFDCPVVQETVLVSSELLVHQAPDGTELSRARIGVDCSCAERCSSVAVLMGDVVTFRWENCAYLHR